MTKHHPFIYLSRVLSKDVIQNLCYWWQFSPFPLSGLATVALGQTCCHVRNRVGITYPPADPWKQKRTELTQKSSLGIDVAPWRLSFTHSSSVSDMVTGFTRLSGEDKHKCDELPAWRQFDSTALLHKSQTQSRVRWEDRHRSPQSTYFLTGRQQLLSFSLAMTLENSWWGSAAYSCLLKMIWL